MVATARCTTEQDVAENYTYRQLRHVAETYMKDKMLVVRVIGQSLGGGGVQAGKSGRKVVKQSKKWKSLKIRKTANRAGFRRDIHIIDIEKEPADSLRAKVAAIMNPKRKTPLLGT